MRRIPFFIVLLPFLFSNIALSAEDVVVIPLNGRNSIVVKSWDKKIEDSSRFSQALDNQAILDNETGMVWERTPEATAYSWIAASAICINKVISDRKGWRVPTIEELSTLVDPSQSNPSLPTNHPFNNIQSSTGLNRYWTKSTSNMLTSYAWFVTFNDGSANIEEKTFNYHVWCVRGGSGYNAY